MNFTNYYLSSILMAIESFWSASKSSGNYISTVIPKMSSFIGQYLSQGLELNLAVWYFNGHSHLFASGG